MNEILNNSLTIIGLNKREITRKWHQEEDGFICYMKIIEDWILETILIKAEKNNWKGYTSCVKTAKTATKQ